MGRKIAKIGPATLMISLPSKWAKAHHLAKGDEVDVIEKEGHLLIGTGQSRAKEKIVIDLSGKKDFLKRNFRKAYMQGVDVIEVTFKDAHVMSDIAAITEQMLGFEIVSQSENSCTLRNVAEGLENEFEHLLRRLFLLTLDMARESKHAAEKSDFSRMNNLGDIERMINKYYMFCVRMLHKQGLAYEKEPMQSFHVLFILEQIADHIKQVNLRSAERKIVLDKPALVLFGDAVRAIESLYTLFYKRSDVEKQKQKEVFVKLHAHVENSLAKTKNVFVTLQLAFVLEKAYHASHIL